VLRRGTDMGRSRRATLCTKQETPQVAAREVSTTSTKDRGGLSGCWMQRKALSRTKSVLVRRVGSADNAHYVKLKERAEGDPHPRKRG